MGFNLGRVRAASTASSEDSTPSTPTLGHSGVSKDEAGHENSSTDSPQLSKTPTTETALESTTSPGLDNALAMPPRFFPLKVPRASLRLP
ncbi:hypothetical protein M011DRAFT_230618 [Sporormia fimetaria CBS 119925]|uniref:Uncharacterized protein n=1 Tax=Sporormia fimetaria CBS 119925 TaxID=1340428 RepID=A0A6A6VHL8_9PLEO|nr:hypothetical protein M011DRAFT_230618 [Sporormia fimetaria CBS 119925]